MKVLVLEENRHRSQEITAALPNGSQSVVYQHKNAAMWSYKNARKNHAPYDVIISGNSDFVRKVSENEAESLDSGCHPCKIVFAGHKNGFNSILEAFENGATSFIGPFVNSEEMAECLHLCGVNF